ncbi:unnamed protein product, partial [marine sediment metagenome]
MSLTGNILDQIEPFIGSWSRNSGQLSALKIMERAQDDLFRCDAAGLIWKGSDNIGWPPYLITVADITRYDIVAANLSNVASITQIVNGVTYAVRCRQVRRVFVDTNTDFEYTRKFMGEPYIVSYNNPFRTSNDRTEIAEIPVDSYPARENDAAAINFQVEQGASTDIYFVEFLWEPMRLTSELIPVCVAADFYPALVDYVIGTISQMDNGKSNERLER